MLCMSHFWKGGINMKKQSSCKGMNLKWGTEVAGLFGIYLCHWKLRKCLAGWCSSLCNVRAARVLQVLKYRAYPAVNALLGLVLEFGENSCRNVCDRRCRVHGCCLAGCFLGLEKHLFCKGAWEVVLWHVWVQWVSCGNFWTEKQ